MNRRGDASFFRRFRVSATSVTTPVSSVPSSCVAAVSAGQVFAVWGYESLAAAPVLIPIGPANNFGPAPLSRAQPISFAPGKHPAAFVTRLLETDKGGLTWTLGGASETASAAGAGCPSVGRDTSGLTATLPGGERVTLERNPAIDLADVVVPTEDRRPDASKYQEGRTVGTIDGSFSVSADGAATYSVPLEVPPGRLGVQPELSLVYDSRGGNGLLGVGWSLAGMSEIARCPKTFASGEVAPVRFDRTDRYCLDGDPLLREENPVLSAPLPARLPGQVLAEYRPEHDPFTRVIVTETDAQGPKTFIAFPPAGGKIRTYGGTPNSRLEGRTIQVTADEAVRGSIDERVAPAPVRLTWGLSQTLDRSGNGVTYEYFNTPSCPASVGPCAYELRPAAIRYTTFYPGHRESTPLRSVRFVYTSERRDPQSRYVGGLQLHTSVLLSAIQMWAPDPVDPRLVRSYRLDYNESRLFDAALPGNDSGLSRLEEIKECDANNVCKDPTSFTWERGAGYFEETALPLDAKSMLLQSPAGDGGEARGGIVVADINGDGLDDILYPKRTCDVRLDTRDEQLCALCILMPRSYACDRLREQGRFVLIEWYYHLSNGAGFGPKTRAASFEQLEPRRGGPIPMPRPLDIDGDGRIEIAFPFAARTTAKGDAWEYSAPSWDFYRLNDSTGRLEPIGGRSAELTPSISPSCTAADPPPCLRWPAPLYIADLNGDELPEIVRSYVAGFDLSRWAIRGNNGGTLASSYDLVSGPDPLRSHLFGDTYVTSLDGTSRAAFLFRTYVTVDPSKPSFLSHFYRAAFLGTDAKPTTVPTSLASGFDVGADRYARTSGYHLLLDVNGDGLTDALRIPNAGDLKPPYSGGAYPTLAFNTGAGFRGPIDVSADKDPKLAFNPRDGRTPDPGVRLMDIDLDGRLDVVLFGNKGPYDADLGDLERTEVIVHRSTSGGFRRGQRLYAIKEKKPASSTGSTASKAAPIAIGPHVFARGYPFSQTLDVDGDGLTDFIQLVGTYAGDLDGEIHLYRRAGSKADQIIAIADGLGKTVTIAYAPYRQPALTDPRACSYPRRCSVRGLSVVSAYSVAGDTLPPKRYELSYSGAAFDLVGRGFLGFSERVLVDKATETTVTTRYDNSTRVGTSYPFARIAQVTETNVVLRDGPTTGLLRTTSKITRFRVLGAPERGSPYTVRPAQVEYEERDKLGRAEPLRARTSIYQYDPLHGGVTNEQVFTKRGASGGTLFERVVVFSGEVSSWFVGTPGQVEETSTVLWGAKSRRLTTHIHDVVTGLLRKQVVEQDGGPAARLETTYVRDAQGRPISIVAKESLGAGLETGRETSFAYDSIDGVHLVSVVNPAGHVTRTVFHPAYGLLARLEDANGVTTRWRYDTFGRVRKTLSPDGGDVEVRYLSSARGGAYAVEHKHASGARQVVHYDSFLRPVWSERAAFDGSLAHVQVKYDPRFASLPATVTAPFFDGARRPATSFLYDNLGRLSVQASADGAIVEHFYEGTVVRTKDPELRETLTRFDELDRPELVVHRGVISTDSATPHDVETTYSYTPFGLLESIVDAKGNVVSFEYDARGRRTAIADPDAGKTSTTYNAFGDVLSARDANGTETTYVVDPLGRPLASSNETDGVTCFRWDSATHGVGLLASRTAAAGTADAVTETFVYDALSRPIEHRTSVQGTEHTLGVAYDAFGRLGALTYPPAGAPGPLVARYDYAVSGELRAVSLGAVALWKGVSRDASGRLLDERFGNGVTTSRRYDELRGSLASIKSASSAGVPIQHLRYGYDNSGLVRSRTDLLLDQTERYDYDAIGHLERWYSTSPAFDTRYRYDDLGNLRSRTSGASATDFPVGPAHRLATTADATYAYDATGNLTSSPGRTVDYTAFGLPKTITGDDDATTSFLYDASHRRVRKEAADGTATLSLHPFYERETSASVTTHAFTVHAEGRPVAQVLRTEGSLPLEATRYLHDDHLGSIVTTTDESGAEVTVTRQRFEPFGARVLPTDPRSPGVAPPTSSLRGFTGHTHDDDLGLVDMRGRLYDPFLGRFLTPDPLLRAPTSGRGLNRYAYVQNSPINFTDPTGFDLECANGCTWTGPPDTIYGRKTLGSVVGPEHVPSSSHRNPVIDALRYDDNGAQRMSAPSQSVDTPVGPTPWVEIEREVRSGDLGYRRRVAEQNAASTGSAVMFVAMTAAMVAAPTFAPMWAVRGGYGLVGVASAAGLSSDEAPDAVPRMLAMAGGVGGLPSAAAIAAVRPRAYSVAAEVTIPKAGVGTYQSHFAAANAMLLESMAADAELAARVRSAIGHGFESSILSPSGRILGRSPTSWTWHHVADRPGVLQLVPLSQHAPGSTWQHLLHPNGVGGMSIWGDGY